MSQVTESYTAKIYSGQVFTSSSNEVSIEAPDPLNLPWEASTIHIDIYVHKHVVVNGEVFSTEPKQLGPSYYHPDSKLLSHKDVRESADRVTLLWNMEVNDWSHVIESPRNFVSPYIAGKTIILQR